MKTILIVICLFVLWITTSHSQQALERYYITVNLLENQPESKDKSKQRGKALAIFYDERVKEIGVEKAKNETVDLFRKYTDYDFYAAFSFLMKVENLDHATAFMTDYMQPTERNMIRQLAAQIDGTQTEKSYPSGIPLPGTGMKGAWINSKPTTVSGKSDQVDTDDGRAEFNQGYAAFQEKKYIEAINWYKKSAEKGEIASMYNLGSMYSKGQGVVSNYSEAYNWFKKAADKGLAIAMKDVGTMHYMGFGVVKDETEALKWFHKAAENGDIDAMVFLSDMYWFGNGTKQDVKTAKEWLYKAAEKGDTLSVHFKNKIEKGNRSGIDELNKGKTFYTQKNYLEAEAWLAKAADKNNVEAMHLLGKVYLETSPVKDIYFAYYWIWEAICYGDEEAVTTFNNLDVYETFSVKFTIGSTGDVGILMNSFIGLYKDEKKYDKAYYWAQRAANYGYDFGMLELGNLYYEGWGVAKNTEKATEWYKKAAEKGNDIATGMLKSMGNK